MARRGKTPVLSAPEARHLLDSIDTTTLAGLRDRALIGVMVYTFARVGAVTAMRTEDYFRQGKRWWLRLHEKGGKRERSSGPTTMPKRTWTSTSKRQGSIRPAIKAGRSFRR